jgi:4-diphosphocytidyl-2-C-methyl-D-erythritol kinase
MIIFPKAKINLGLHITGKRPDGYHNIETVFYPVSLNDALEFVSITESVNTDILTLTGLNTGIDPKDNLVFKTVKKLHEKYSFPYLNIHLHKAIPIGSGLGGGSSDAALILLTINKFFGLLIDDQELKEISLELGSDCPFFIVGEPAFATGRGNILKPVPHVLSGYYLVLINPGIEISTKEAYQNCRPKNHSISLLQLINRPIAEWNELILNDLEDFAFNRHPIIGKIKKELHNLGALFSLMSGSGSSVYGIFREKIKLPVKLNDLVVWEGMMI